MLENKNLIEIILVDDNPNDAELAIRALKKHNMANKMVHLKDGAEALEFIFGKNDSVEALVVQPKLILLDIKMPKVDGIEVLRKLKSDSRTKKIPVVVMTSSQEGKDMVESYNLGVNAYVVKPLDFHEFANTVKEIGLFWILINKIPDQA